MTVAIYRSTDVGAPLLNGSVSAMIDVLNACLVNGYGSLFATGTITSNATTVSNNDTITINGTVYTWKTALTPAANEILIGASAATNLSNLAAAIMGWGVSGTNYGAGTTQQQGSSSVIVSNLTATVLTLQARKGGTGGNSIALAKSAANITLSGATLSGGSGTDTTASLGWTAAFSGTNQVTYKMPAGTGFYLNVLDDGSVTAGTREGAFWGMETASALGTGTNLFPTVAQIAAGLKLRKSDTLDQVPRAWMLIGDNRTFHLFTLPTNSYCGGMSFGDISSYLAGDVSGCQAIGRATSAAVDAVGNEGLDISVAPATNVSGGHYMARNYGQIVGAINNGILINGYQSNAGSATTTVAWGVNAPSVSLVNPVDNTIHLTRPYVIENTVPAPAVRGVLRGLWMPTRTATITPRSMIFNGTGTLTGRQFQSLPAAGPNSSMMYVEISNTWDA